MIYFDHAASSFPKPKSVLEAVNEALLEYGANPGRGGHSLALRAAETVYQSRVAIAKLFGLGDPKRVLFYSNATGALNQAIKGFPLEKGDHVITTNYEHNSVRRPLEFLKNEKGMELTYVSVPEDGAFQQDVWEEAIKETTKLIVVTHASNLTGLLLPVEEIAEFAHRKGVPILVDASQTAGVVPIDMDKSGIDMLACPGHKGLLGPQGTGVLLVRKGLEINPIHHGGTGSHSELIDQPEKWPARYESGTLNTPGIAGLLAGVKEVSAIGPENILNHEQALVNHMIDGLQKLEGVHVLGTGDTEKHVGVISFTIDGVDSQEVAMILDSHYHIAVRGGLHCTPLAHDTHGTMNGGAIRASFGYTNTLEEVEQFLEAVEEITIGFNG